MRSSSATVHSDSVTCWMARNCCLYVCRQASTVFALHHCPYPRVTSLTDINCCSDKRIWLRVVPTALRRSTWSCTQVAAGSGSDLRPCALEPKGAN